MNQFQLVRLCRPGDLPKKSRVDLQFCCSKTQLFISFFDDL